MLVLLWACSGDPGPVIPTETAAPVTDTDTDVPEQPAPVWPVERPNILVLIADDVGIDGIQAFDAPADQYPQTPAIDGLIADGMRFTRAYADPVCTPTRFTALSGRYARRRGVGRPIFADEDWEVARDEVSLAEVLVGAGYTSIALGKWHLSSDQSDTSYDHPRLWGFTHHGFLQKLDYWNGVRNDDGVVSVDPLYQTTSLVNDIVHYANTTDGPWLIWAGFLSAHRPIHVPPPELNPAGVTDSDPEVVRYIAMIEAMDMEIGRMLAELDPAVRENTVIVFLGDNGTIRSFLSADWVPQEGKGSVFEGGVRVPFTVSGPGVPAGTSTDTLVHTADLFPTLIEIAGLDPDDFSRSTVGHWDAVAEGAVEPWLADWDGYFPPVVIDGASFAGTLLDPAVPSPRRYVYTERFWPKGPPPYPNDLRGLRDERFKMVDRTETDVLDGVRRIALHDLAGRHDDGPDVLSEPDAPLSAEAQEAVARLMAVMDAHDRVLVYEPYTGDQGL